MAWTPITPPPNIDYGYALGAAGDRLYSLGGSSGGAMVDVASLYSYLPNTWTPVASLPAVHVGGATIALGGRLYLVGGYADGYQAADTVWSYDPTDDAAGWTAHTPMPFGVQILSVGAYAGKLWMNQTSGGSTLTADIYAYDPTDDAAGWVLQPTPLPRVTSGALLVGTPAGLFAIAGTDASYRYTALVDLFDGSSWSTLAPLPVNNPYVGGYRADGLVWANTYRLDPTNIDAGWASYYFQPPGGYNPSDGGWASTSNFIYNNSGGGGDTSLTRLFAPPTNGQLVTDQVNGYTGVDVYLDPTNITLTVDEVDGRTSASARIGTSRVHLHPSNIDCTTTTTAAVATQHDLRTDPAAGSTAVAASIAVATQHNLRTDPAAGFTAVTAMLSSPISVDLNPNLVYSQTGVAAEMALGGVLALSVAAGHTRVSTLGDRNFRIDPVFGGTAVTVTLAVPKLKYLTCYPARGSTAVRVVYLPYSGNNPPGTVGAYSGNNFPISIAMSLSARIETLNPLVAT